MANKCPQCQSDLRNWFRRHIVLSILWVFIILFSILAANGSDENVQQQVLERELQENMELIAEMNISAVQLSEEYDDNKVAADAKYENKVLEISGIVDDIGKDILDEPYVVLKGREISLFGVQCMFSRADESKLAGLSKGQSIVLKGRVSGEFIGNVLVRGCTIVN